MVQLTFPEAMIHFIISIMTHFKSKVLTLLVLTLYRSLIAFNYTLVAPSFSTYRNLK